jgi:hypothetical protein
MSREEILQRLKYPIAHLVIWLRRGLEQDTTLLCELQSAVLHFNQGRLCNLFQQARDFVDQAPVDDRDYNIMASADFLADEIALAFYTLTTSLDQNIDSVIANSKAKEICDMISAVDFVMDDKCPELVPRRVFSTAFLPSVRNNRGGCFPFRST